MDAAYLIERYGYLAILVGTCFEGEAIMVIGGYAARSGQLSFTGILMCGAIGVLVSDWSCFLAGRLLNGPLLRRFPSLENRVKRPLELIERHQVGIIFLFQFIPGSSTVTPIALGMSRVKVWRFGLLNVAGVVVWTVVFGGVGYACGSVVSKFVISDWHIYDEVLIGAFFIVLAFMIIWRYLRRYRGSDA